ncbi:hypothetical protein ACTFIW_001878 [Dictyostelium discoideum]
MEDLINEKKYFDNILGCIYGQCLGDAYGLSTVCKMKHHVDRWYPKVNENSLIDFPNYKIDDYMEGGHTHDRGDWGIDSDNMILLLQSIIKVFQHTNDINSNNSSSNSNNNNNNELFFKVYRNIFLKNKIWDYIRIQEEGEEDDAILKIFIRKLKVYYTKKGFQELGDWDKNWFSFCRGRQTTPLVVRNEEFLNDPMMVSKYYYLIESTKYPNDTGALMRSSIIPCMNFLNEKQQLINTVNFSKVTHYDPRSVTCCIIQNNLITTILNYYYYNNININNNNNNNNNISNLLSKLIKIIYEDKKIEKLQNYYNERNGMFENEIDKRRKIGISNYLIYSARDLGHLNLERSLQGGFSLSGLASSIYSLKKFNQYFNQEKEKLINSGCSDGLINLSFLFRKVLDELIREGGDNNGASTGALLGSIIGYSNLPKDMLQSMPNKQWLDDQVIQFIKLLDERIVNGKIIPFTISDDQEQNIYSSIGYNNGETQNYPFVNFENNNNNNNNNNKNKNKNNNNNNNNNDNNNNSNNSNSSKCIIQ